MRLPNTVRFGFSLLFASAVWLLPTVCFASYWAWFAASFFWCGYVASLIHFPLRWQGRLATFTLPHPSQRIISAVHRISVRCPENAPQLARDYASCSVETFAIWRGFAGQRESMNESEQESRATGLIACDETVNISPHTPSSGQTANESNARPERTRSSMVNKPSAISESSSRKISGACLVASMVGFAFIAHLQIQSLQKIDSVAITASEIRATTSKIDNRLQINLSPTLVSMLNQEIASHAKAFPK